MPLGTQKKGFISTADCIAARYKDYCIPSWFRASINAQIEVNDSLTGAGIGFRVKILDMKVGTIDDCKNDE